MKSTFLILISIFLVSCSTQKVLKTDTQQEIDLSGRWNETDAEIASSELFGNLIAAPWLKDFKSKNEANPTIEVKVFTSNTKGIDENLTRYFESYISANNSIELLSKDSNTSPDYQLYGEIKAKESVAKDFVEYTILIRLANQSGKAVQKDRMVVKKYIKN